MGRYVVIDFDKKEEADEFIHRHLNEFHGIGQRVVGIFVKPGKTCNCWDKDRINYGDKLKEHGVSRGAKFGWWVCERCGKPRKAGHQLVNQISASDTHEGPSFDDYEMTVTGLSITGIHRKQIKRKKKLRDKEKRK